jgi:hypothetical protein
MVSQKTCPWRLQGQVLLSNSQDLDLDLSIEILQLEIDGRQKKCARLFDRISETLAEKDEDDSS